MRQSTVIMVVGTTLSAFALAACGSSTSGSSAVSTSAPPSASNRSSSAPSAAVAAGSAADIAFAQMMIPHHEQAVQMADMALARKSDASPQVQALAAQIQAAQGPEIAQMQNWLAVWGAPSVMASASTNAMGDMPGMDMGGVTSQGMMTAEQMTALGQKSGPAFDQMWLEMMISHHQGAILMAEQVQAESANPQVNQMASSIIASQQAEIATMQQMLAGS